MNEPKYIGAEAPFRADMSAELDLEYEVEVEKVKPVVG
jgi:hypothetical protein